MNKKRKYVKKTEAKKEQNQEMEIADGVSTEGSHQTLSEILGQKQKNPFEVSSSSELDDKMSNMTLIDLQKLAVKAGVFPSGTKPSLKTKIQKAYSAANRGAGRITPAPSNPIMDPRSKEGIEAARKLKELLS